VLIDTGEGKSSWSIALQSLLKSEKADIVTVLLTHWHPDHVGGVKDVLEIFPNAKIYKHRIQHDPESYLDIHHTQRFDTDGATLSAVFSPGHTDDHTAFMLLEETAMFTGDNVLGHGTAKFEDLGLYLESLQTMLKEAPLRLYPGHGEVIDDGTRKITEYTRHRQEREDQVMQVLQSKDSGRSESFKSSKWDPMQVVKIVYKDVPENLHQAAHHGVIQILEKLQTEKKVQKDHGLWITAENASL
jgi:ribonuclease/clavin/mitogillin